MEKMEEKDLENKFCLYLNDLKIKYSNFDEVKQMINNFCNENNLQSKKVFTSHCIRQIFGLCNFWISITLDDAKKFLNEYLNDKKISFMTLNSLMVCMKIKVCGLKEWRDFIETYVHQSEHHSELDEEINFFRNLDWVVNLEKESLDKSDAPAAQFFSDWQSKIIGISNITNDNYMSVNSLAIKLLEFKTKTKQYSKVEDIQADILFYIEKIVLSSQKQNNFPNFTLGCYFNALLNAPIEDKEYKKKIFNTEFIKRIKNKILGDDKKRSNYYQIMFLFNLLKFFYDLYDPKELPKKNIFDGFYSFVFGVRNEKAIKEIVDNASDKIKRSIANHFLSFTHEYVDNDSKSFKNFCNIFGLQIEKGKPNGITSIESGSPQINIETIKGYLLDCYSLSQDEAKIKYINVQEKVYDAKICIKNENEDRTYNLTSYTLKQKETVACDIKVSSSYKKNSRAYEVFVAIAFLIFGFIPLIILKSIFDILFLPIKVIINIFHSAITAFKRKEYLWKFPDFENETEGHLGMFLHFLIDLIVGLLFIAFSPLYNNFFGSKYLFHKSGTGQKLITFNNWHFYQKQSDSDRSKNFDLTEINLRFIIKYIFGFACLAKSEDSELKMELNLTNNNQLDKKSSILKLSNEILGKYRSSALTNEYSPLSYLETIK